MNGSMDVSLLMNVLMNMYSPLKHTSNPTHIIHHFHDSEPLNIDVFHLKIYTLFILHINIYIYIYIYT